MSDVNWDNVPQPGQTAKKVEKSSPLGTVVFVVLLLVGLAVGGVYLNTLLLGDRVRNSIAEKECQDSTCRIDVRSRHDDCFSQNLSYGMPSGLGDFQTPDSSPKLGIGTVNLDGYRACVLPATKKTLAAP